MLMGCGIAVMQPALPTLVREWVPHRIGLGTAVSSNGMMVGVAAGPALTIPFVLPLLDQSWRLTFLWWAAPVLALALVFPLLAPRHAEATTTEIGMPRQWWPDWKNPLIWLLGLTFGANNSLYYGTNAFLPDYLASAGRADLIGAGARIHERQPVRCLDLAAGHRRPPPEPHVALSGVRADGAAGRGRHHVWRRVVGGRGGRARRVFAVDHVRRHARAAAAC